jgi:hypothetical protein
MKSLVNLTLPSLLISLVGMESGTDAIAQTASSFAVTSPANGASVTSPFQVQLSVGSSWVNVAGFQGNTNVCPDVTPSGGGAVLTCTVPSGSQTIDIAAFSVPSGTACAPGASCRSDINLSVNVGASAPAPTAGSPPPAAGTGVQAYQANSFLNSIGVNIHMYDGIGNTNIETMINYAGFRWYRGGGNQESATIANTIAISQATGARATEGMLTGTPWTQSTLQSTIIGGGDQLAAASIPSGKPNAGLPVMLGFELSNEPNNFPISYNGTQCGGSGSWSSCGSMAAALYSLKQADSVAKNYPIWSFSLTGGETSNVPLQFATVPSSGSFSGGLSAGTQIWDYANGHNYYNNNGSYAANGAWAAMDPVNSTASQNNFYNNFLHTWKGGYSGYSSSQFMGICHVITEIGTTLQSVGTADQQGRATLAFYLSGFKELAPTCPNSQTYTAIYQLITDPSTDGSGNDWGIFGSNYSTTSPKAPALYLHNLTTILADTATFSPGTLNYSIASEPSTTHDLLLQKANGAFYLVIWDDRLAGSAAQNVSVSFGEMFNTVNVYNAETGTSPVTTAGGAASITLSLKGGDVDIIQLQ